MNYLLTCALSLVGGFTLWLLTAVGLVILVKFTFAIRYIFHTFLVSFTKKLTCLHKGGLYYRFLKVLL